MTKRFAEKILGLSFPFLLFAAGEGGAVMGGGSLKICNEFQNMQNLQGWEGVGENFPRIVARLSKRFCNYAANY